MNYWKSYFLSLILIFAFSSCGNRGNCYVEYSFEIDFDLLPSKSVFKVGDTITIESTIPSTLKDGQSNMLIDLGRTFDFPIIFSIEMADSTSGTTALEAFQIHFMKGDFSVYEAGGLQTLDLRYEIQGNNDRILKYSITPLKTGVYSLGFGYFTPYYRDDFLMTANHCIESASLSMETNGEQSNYYLIEPFAYFNSFYADSLSYSKESGGYAFEVIE